MAAYTRVTLTDLLTRLSDYVGGTAINFWGATEKTDAINEAISLWQALTGEYIVTYSPVAITSGTIYYPVPKQIASVTRVLYNGTPLTESSIPELDLGNSAWVATANGTPIYWAPVGINDVAINPPAASGNLTFEGIGEAPRLVNGGDFLDIGEEALVSLIRYAHHYLTFKEGGVELEATKEALGEIVKAAGRKNSELLALNFHKRYQGLQREEGERPSIQEAGVKAGARTL